MIFIDASAMVSIIAGEADCDILADRLELATQRFCSAVSVWETVTALCRSHKLSEFAARRAVESFRQAAKLALVPIGEAETAIALDAYTKFGKGRHRAALNMGDCFAYACAKANNAKLLFKGEDFARTDIAAA